FVIRHCRVGILNEIGELLTPEVAILLIGERPGLATAESLSAYIGYRPQGTNTDANRNLISNIHARGVSTDDAVVRILNLAGRMMKLRASGYSLREELPVLGSSESFIYVLNKSRPRGFALRGAQEAPNTKIVTGSSDQPTPD